MTAALMINTVVHDRFELVARLDDRGYGESFRAQDRRLRSRFVTLKFLRAVSGGELPEPLVDHAQLLRQFKHPGVLATVGHGLHQGRPFLVHEFVEGKSLGAGLDEARETGQLLPVKLLEAIFARIAAVIAAGHARAQPVVHGCLTPGCVILQQIPGKDLDVRLFDFGVTRFADPDPAAPARSARALMFLAPEQIQAPDSVPTPAMDVFGLGALLREMLSMPPDPGATLTPTTLLRRRDDCPMELWNAAGVAMSASPSDRYTSVDEFLEIVQRCWAAAPPPAPASAAPARQRPQPPPLTDDTSRPPEPWVAPVAVAPSDIEVLQPRYELPPLPVPRPVADYAATLALDETSATSHPWSAPAIPTSFTSSAQPVVSSMDDLLRAVQSGPRATAAPRLSPQTLDRTNLLDEGSDFSRQQREALVTTEAGTLVLEDDVDFSATSIDPPKSDRGASFRAVAAGPRDPNLAGTMILNDPSPAPAQAAKVEPTPAPSLELRTKPPPSADLGSTIVLDGMGGSPAAPAPSASPAFSLPLGPPPNAPSVLPPLHVVAPAPLPSARTIVTQPDAAEDSRYQLKVAALAVAVLGGLGLALILVKMLFESSR
jgi:hypothetical protein